MTCGDGDNDDDVNFDVYTKRTIFKTVLSDKLILSPCLHPTRYVESIYMHNSINTVLHT